MSFHVCAVSVSPCGVDHTVNRQSIPWNFARSRDLEHSRSELLVDQVICPELRARSIGTVAFEEVVKYFRFSDIRDSDDFNIVAVQGQVIEVSPDLTQTHYTDLDFSITHGLSPPICSDDRQYSGNRMKELDQNGGVRLLRQE
jgi:hypothetical protein